MELYLYWYWVFKAKFWACQAEADVREGNEAAAEIARFLADRAKEEARAVLHSQ